MRKLEAQNKRSNIWLMDISERESKGRHGEGIIKEIIQENCRTWISRLKEPLECHYKEWKKPASKNIIVKFQYIRNKENKPIRGFLLKSYTQDQESQ